MDINKTVLGIELGSTRIKAVLIDEQFTPIAAGAHDWENRLEDGVWTYHLDDVWTGLQTCVKNLADDVQKRYGVALNAVGAIGISAMMHGYLVFDNKGNQLVPFRTWRNTSTGQAAQILTEKLKFNIPQRWSIAHLYQAMLNKESHVKDIDFITTLAGYVQWKLTGEKVLGIDDASGMFPIDSSINDYDAAMLGKFGELTQDYDWKINDILPKVLNAGENAGQLSAEGAKLLDPSGVLKPGILLCPPEGDAGTGMVATNSVGERTGNISAGTSIFTMVVLEKALSKVYPEIDMVTTPAGKPVAMVHCNNCTSDLDAWVKLFRELCDLAGANINKAALYDALYFKALEGESDCGGLLSWNFYSGEPLANVDQGRPLFVRSPESNFTLANFMRTLLFSAMAALKFGMDILEKENVRIDSLLGHGGLFKTKKAGQKLMAAALNTPVSVMESAAEGGAWGIALLASYMLHKQNEPLEQFLSEQVFSGMSSSKEEPNADSVKGFNHFMDHYTRGLALERIAYQHI